MPHSSHPTTHQLQQQGRIHQTSDAVSGSGGCGPCLHVAACPGPAVSDGVQDERCECVDLNVLWETEEMVFETERFCYVNCFRIHCASAKRFGVFLTIRTTKQAQFS